MSALLPWQQGIWNELVKRHHNAGLPHALMLTGLPGIGKDHLARHLAQWLLCQSPDQQAQPCGQCHSCQLWQAGNHPDFLHCRPDDKSRQIRIDNIRIVNEFLAQTPQISRCQVVFITPIEVMNINAANALLKTLEEPAGESFLILEAERVGSVLPTIRSRCQKVQLPPPSQSESLHWLQQQGRILDESEQALRFYPQAPLNALQWLQNGQADVQQQWLDELTQWSQQIAPLQRLADSWSKLELGDVIGWLSTLLVDALKYRLGVAADQLRYQQAIRSMLPADFDTGLLMDLQRKVQDIHGHLLSGASHYNRQLLIESLLLDWQDIVQSAQHHPESS